MYKVPRQAILSQLPLRQGERLCGVLVVNGTSSLGFVSFLRSLHPQFLRPTLLCASGPLRQRRLDMVEKKRYRTGSSDGSLRNVRTKDTEEMDMEVKQPFPSTLHSLFRSFHLASHIWETLFRCQWP